MDVTSLCGGCEATQLHVLDKSLYERCHIGILQVGMWVTCDTPSPVCRKPRTRQCQDLLLPPAIVPVSQPLTAKRFSSPGVGDIPARESPPQAFRRHSGG